MISETTSWFELGPWSCTNRVCIMHKLAEHWTGTCRNVLASSGWLALWGGCTLCRVEWRAGEAADVIRLNPVYVGLRSSYRKPIWIHLRLVNAVLRIQWSVGTKSLKHGKAAQKKKLPGHKRTCALTVCSNTSHSCTSSTSLVGKKNNSSFY